MTHNKTLFQKGAKIAARFARRLRRLFSKCIPISGGRSAATSDSERTTDKVSGSFSAKLHHGHLDAHLQYENL